MNAEAAPQSAVRLNQINRCCDQRIKDKLSEQEMKKNFSANGVNSD